MVLKLTPMVEEKNTDDKMSKFTPSYDDALSFVLTSKNIGAILAIKATNNFREHEMKDQILESTTKKSETDDYLTLLKIEKKEIDEPKEDSDDKYEFVLTYFEAKDDKLVRSSLITLSLGQMIVFRLLCKQFINENLFGWGMLRQK
jgi:hypothetical protein